MTQYTVTLTRADGTHARIGRSTEKTALFNAQHYVKCGRNSSAIVTDNRTDAVLHTVTGRTFRLHLTPIHGGKPYTVDLIAQSAPDARAMFAAMGGLTVGRIDRVRAK